MPPSAGEQLQRIYLICSVRSKYVHRVLFGNNQSFGVTCQRKGLAPSR